MVEEDNRMAFSYILSQLRRDKGITQREAAKQLDITPATLSAYENGVKKPSLDVVVRLADFYNVTLDSLLRPEKPIRGTMRTHGDAARALADLDYSLGGMDVEADQRNPAGVVLTIYNSVLRDFLVKNKHNQAAMRDFGGGYEMYEAWVERYTTQLDAKPLFVNEEENYGLPDEAYLPDEADKNPDTK